jgi:hypothetical protein
MLRSGALCSRIGLPTRSGHLSRIARIFIIDYHVLYAVLCTYLIVKPPGHVCDLDGCEAESSPPSEHPALRPLVA